jgi:DNA primase catalytic subunit
LVVAVKVIDRALREDLGYKRLLWVFSGRRGLHLWVCDREAMLMEDEDRRKVMDKLVGFRNLNGEEVSTWRSESYAGDSRHGTNEVSKERKFADRMRRPINVMFQ